MRKLLSMLLITTFLISFLSFKHVAYSEETQHEMAIAMATDNNYVLPTIVAMTSMLENANSDSFYKYYLLVSEDFTKENEDKFLNLQNLYNEKCSINFLKMSKEFDNKPTASHISSATYFRLRLPSLLQNERKCLYLDGDIVVLGDLWELYNMDISNYYIAGVKAAGIQSYGNQVAKKLSIPDIKKYVNAGILLMNLELMRKDHIERKFDEFIPKLKKMKSIGADQDTLNAVCYDKIYNLPFKYNVMTCYDLFDNDAYERTPNDKYKNCYDQSEWDEGRNNPVIIHYVDRKKPWKYSAVNYLFKWWKYAELSPVYKEIKSTYFPIFEFPKNKKRKRYNRSARNRGRDYAYNLNLPSKKYTEELKAWYKKKTGQELNLDDPQTYDEKIQWVKLYDSTPMKTLLADKFMVRDWVKEKIGEKYLTPLLGVWDSFDEIDFDKLPDKFVLKCNHGGGWNIIVTDKSKFNKAAAKKKFDFWMKRNYAFNNGFELHYRDIVPKIIAEEYMENNNNDLYDYKIMCFNGVPEFIWVDSNRFTHHQRVIYDTQWNELPFRYNYDKPKEFISKPENLDEMLEIAKILSKGFEHVRVDLYRLNDGTLKFGEMTFTTHSGIAKWYPPEYNKIIGDKFPLPKEKFLIK